MHTRMRARLRTHMRQRTANGSRVLLVLYVLARANTSPSPPSTMVMGMLAWSRSAEARLHTVRQRASSAVTVFRVFPHPLSLQRRELDSSLSPPAPFPVDEAERPCLYHVLGIHPATSSHPPRGEQGKSQVSQKRGSSPTSLGPVTRPTSHGLAARGMLVVANEQRPKSLFPKSSRPTKGPHPSNLGLLGAFGVKQQPRPWHCALQSRPSMPSPNRAISPLEQPTAGAAHLAQSTGAVALGSRL